MDSRIARLEQVISQRLDTEREDTRERELKNLQEMSQCMEQFRTEMLEDAAHGRRVSWTDTENFTQKITENLERRYERFSQIETEKTIEAQQAMITTMQIALEAKIEALRDDVTRAHEHMSADSRGTNAPVEVLSTTQWTGIIFLCLGSAIATSAGILEWSRIGKKMPYTSLMLKKQTGEPFYRNLIQNSGGYKSSR
jgi:predicted RNase H-like nuclease (RuvC/YqgF family)